METQVQRGEAENVGAAREAKVKALCDMVKDDLKHWEYAFKRMRAWRKFARGMQWPGSTKESQADPDRKYVANVTLRHLKQRTDSTYARNPKFIWRRSKRLFNKNWDGTAQQLQIAEKMVSSGGDSTGYWTAILQEAMQSRAESTALRKTGETLAALYEYSLREQIPPAKKMMKKQVMSSLNCGVAYFKQTFQRATQLSPDIERSLADNMAQLATLERISSDMADGEIDPNEAQTEQLRQLIAQLESKPQIILREGLAFDYPDSTNIIPDRNMTYLPGFVGCSHVTEQYNLTSEKIQEVYGVDIRGAFTAHKGKSTDSEDGQQKLETACVWEIWDRGDNLIYTVCEGFNDYLIEPEEPTPYTERFYPWFVFAPNAMDDTEDPFPPSDVELIEPMQMEINRAGEGLRQHRYAARPGHVTGSNVPEEDAKKMANRLAHDVITLKGMEPDEDIRKKFQAFPTSPLDPNLYATGPAFSDILHASGSQEANLGGTSGSTATETSIAESSRQTMRTSTVDDLDDLLTEMARAGGQILLQEMSEDQVKVIVGPGAVWPDQSREEIARELHLEVVSGSSGRPNQAQQVQVRERMFPLLFQLPGLDPEFLTKDLLRVIDDSINYEDAIDMEALSVIAVNGQAQASANRGGGGADNAPKPPAAGPTGPPGAGQSGFG